ncbi:hypothetical protein EYB25_007824 [Talaromyces marneffei]|nr:hypothetical protein EYB25_007824 [Talaromyces marneffei]
MDLTGYIPYTVNPFETASNATAIVTASNTTAGTASTRINFQTGKYDIAVNYYDVTGGVSHWKLFINDKQIGEWDGDHEFTLGHAPSVHLDGHSASRVTFRGISVKKGDLLKIWGQPDGIEQAALDYVVFLPKGVVD